MSQTPTTYGLPKKKAEVIEVLKLAYANQNLEDQEYERRLEEATNATSIEELELVLFDFPTEIRQRIFSVKQPLKAQPSQIYRPTAHPSSRVRAIMTTETRHMPECSNTMPKLMAVMSTQRLDFRLSQVPDVSATIYLEAIMSNYRIDLRNRQLDGKEINIHIQGLMSEVRIFLPRGVRIQRDIQMIMGEFKIRDKQKSWIKRLTGTGNQEDQPDMDLTVRISGMFWLGKVVVTY